MTCKDCIFEPQCILRISYSMGDDDITGKASTNMEELCRSFKNKAGFVEVVRCCECKNGVRYVVNNDTFLYKCRKMGISGFADDFYCGYGERK